MPANQPDSESANIHPTPPDSDSAAERVAKPKRGEDFGNTLLPGMAQFQLLARKVKQPLRLQRLIEHLCDTSLPSDLIQEICSTKAALPPKLRTQIYAWLAQTATQQLATLEKISSRITALTDIFGHQAVMAMLDLQNEQDALVLADPSEKWSRALYLYLAQFVDTPDIHAGWLPDTRFEQAERRQSMNQHWNSKDFASHYLGPKDTEPLPLAAYEQALREQVAALYPGVNPQLIVIDHHCTDDISHTHRHGLADQALGRTQRQHTISATFNAARAQYKTVVGDSATDAQIVEVDQPAAIEVVFAWESATGMLGVFCPDNAYRPSLASSFQQLVLGIEGLPNQIPMCSFDLQAFGDAAVLQQIAGTLVDGVQDLAIQKIRLTNPIAVESAQSNIPARSRTASNSLQISRHSRDRRSIYQVSRDVYRIPAIDGHDISHVTLSLVMKDQPDCKAHRVAVHVARPNGLTHGCKSALDRQIMQLQLSAIGVMNLAMA
ncbi:MAG: hypothetical protein KBF66_03205 [Rhodoferax sp.]|uniref:hypothetical protein n=1 Tax=Rhodoferax sp. TaxID=50421 RepID=UPI001B4A2132|nr:hypothetical protein [Rhodoferax sp.]MBP9904539.1 hypothetical protein [Rhodoferax sp.]